MEEQNSDKAVSLADYPTEWVIKKYPNLTKYRHHLSQRKEELQVV